MLLESTDLLLALFNLRRLVVYLLEAVHFLKLWHCFYNCSRHLYSLLDGFYVVSGLHHDLRSLWFDSSFRNLRLVLHDWLYLFRLSRCDGWFGNFSCFLFCQPDRRITVEVDHLLLVKLAIAVLIAHSHEIVEISVRERDRIEVDFLHSRLDSVPRLIIIEIARTIKIKSLKQIIHMFLDCCMEDCHDEGVLDGCW